MSDYDRDQRGYSNSDWRERYSNSFRGDERNEERDDRDAHENYGRFERGHDESRLNRRPSNQWGNYGTQESSHDRRGTGSYFGSRGYPYGNYEMSNRDDRQNYYRNRGYRDQHNDRRRTYGQEHEPYRGYNQYDYEEDMVRSSWPLSNERNWRTEQRHRPQWQDEPRQFGDQGIHRGKGPKGYNRSDDRIREDINDRLSDNSYVDASEIEVQVMNGEVTLSGSVDERRTKRMAEDIADSVLGVRNVENRLRVNKNESWTIGGDSKTENRGKPKAKSNGFIEAGN